ncbi:MAG: hypothetical protein J6Y28_08635 [Acholeplasmatales bacterium]|nr:hypothetical protein [Acholeplasmatales bacterium]
MRKLRICFLTLVCFLFLFACSKKKDTTTKSNNTTKSVVTTNQNTTNKTTNKTTTKKTTEKQDVYYDVKFVDYDETVLLETKVKEGDTPTYTLTNPTRSKDSDYYYEFSGWSPKLGAVNSNMTYVAQYNKYDLPYVISFDLDGGSSENTFTQIKTDEFSTDYFSYDLTKIGHTFNGWSYKGEIILNAEGELVNTPEIDSEMTFKAIWSKNSYSLTLTSNLEDAGTFTGNGTYEYGDEVTITVNANEGYTYTNITDSNGEITTNTTYTFNMGASSLEYTVNFTANKNTKFTVKRYFENLEGIFELDEEHEEIYYGTTGTYINYAAEHITGYTVKNTDKVKIKGDGSTILYIYYYREVSKVTFVSNPTGASRLTGEGNYKYGETVTLVARTNKGYKYVNITCKNVEVTTESTYIFTMGDKDIEFVANFTPRTYSIKLNSKAEGVTLTGVTSGEYYDYGSLITLTANNVPEGKVIVWSRDDKDDFRYIGETYTFNCPYQSVVITIEFAPYDRIGDKIYYGYYPQTREDVQTVIDNLNNLVGTPQDPKAGYTWVDYGYYASNTVSSLMYYIDLDTDNNGRFDYRGVYIAGYRPAKTSDASSASNSYQPSNNYTINNTYWFKYEVIEWDILEESDGKAMLIANLVLDGQEFYPSNYTGTTSHINNGKTGYVNNYELSTIRQWLNNNFYNTAFNALEKEIIQLTHVDNSARENNTDGIYASNDTDDYIFLLSCNEVNTYFPKEEDRMQVAVTNYALCQGVFARYGYATWYLRSPAKDGANMAYNVHTGGQIDNASCIRTDLGIRPALWITL